MHPWLAGKAISVKADLAIYHQIPYKWIYWQAEYLANRSVIVVGVTLIWRKAVAAIHIIAIKLYWRHLNLADGQKSPN